MKVFSLPALPFLWAALQPLVVALVARSLNSTITAAPKTISIPPGLFNEYHGLTDNATLSSYCQSIYLKWLVGDTTIERVRTRTFWGAVGTTTTLSDGQVTFQATSITFDPVVYTRTGNFPANGVDYFYGSASPPCCSFCTIGVQTVELFFWPTPAPSPAVTEVVNSDGYTFISPSVYLGFSQLSAYDLCGTVGNSYANTTIALDPSELTSVASPFPVPATNNLGFTITSSSYPPPQQVNFADLMQNCSTKPGYAYFPDNPSNFLLPWDPCHPTIIVPQSLKKDNPAWSTCLTNGIGGFYDPPHTLTAVPVMTTTSANIPSVTAQPPSAGPTAEPVSGPTAPPSPPMTDSPPTPPVPPASSPPSQPASPPPPPPPSAPGSNLQDPSQPGPDPPGSALQVPGQPGPNPPSSNLQDPTQTVPGLPSSSSQDPSQPASGTPVPVVPDPNPPSVSDLVSASIISFNSAGRPVVGSSTLGLGSVATLTVGGLPVVVSAPPEGGVVVVNTATGGATIGAGMTTLAPGSVTTLTVGGAPIVVSAPPTGGVVVLNTATGGAATLAPGGVATLTVGGAPVTVSAPSTGGVVVLGTGAATGTRVGTATANVVMQTTNAAAGLMTPGCGAALGVFVMAVMAL